MEARVHDGEERRPLIGAFRGVRLVASARGAISKVDFYWKVARGVAGERLSGADQAHPFEIASLLILSTVVAIPLVGLLAVLESFTTTSRHPWIRVAGLAPSLLIGLTCLAALTWTAVRAKASPAPERLFALSIIAVVPGITVALVATAGLFTAVTRPIGAPNLSVAAFWKATLYFTWTAVDSVPILEVSDLTGWTQTPPSAPGVATWMALFLRLVLLVPLVRVVVASYAWARDRHRASDRDDAWLDDDESIRTSLTLLAWIAGLLVAALAYLRWMATPTSVVPQLVSDRVPTSVTVASRTVDLTWVPSAVQWAALAALLWFAVMLLLGFVLWAVGSRSPIAMGILLVDMLALVVSGTLLAALLLGRLVQSGVGDVTPDVPSGPGVRSSIEYLAWPLVDALPLVGVTDVLGWELDQSFSGVFVGLVQIGYRLAIVSAFVIVPWMLVNLSRRRSDPLIEAAEQFAEHLRSIQTELDLADSVPPGNRRAVLAGCRATVRHDLSRLSIMGRELERVYGYGEVSRAALRAIEAARDETSEALGTSTWRRSSPVWRRPRDTLTLEQAASAFCAAVVRQHRAAEPRGLSHGSHEADAANGA